MSLPLTRRIARAALLVAAGAAPVVVGAAGSASAVDQSLAPTGALTGLTQLDGATTGATLDTASRTTTEVVGETGGKAVGTAVPAAGKTVGTAGRTATPAVQQVAGEAAGSAGEVVGQTAGTAAESAANAPAGGTLGGLPTKGVPAPTLPLGGGLPLGG
ncbi:ATP-binding protein [Streptomyces sp. NPDC048659]|uniref:ATP-binding protein n=1 Tax=Streptomyces sp. NPDC048659 TaxID=3155489 RepID=UPI003439F6CA